MLCNSAFRIPSWERKSREKLSVGNGGAGVDSLGSPGAFTAEGALDNISLDPDSYQGFAQAKSLPGIPEHLIAGE